MNAELLAPFTRNIASSWGRIFETDLFAPFQGDAVKSIRTLLAEVEESAVLSLKDRVRTQGELCIADAKVALQKTIEVVKETMQTEQKEVSRCLAPHVQSQLIDGYDRAMQEVGRGSVARQKVGDKPCKSAATDSYWF